MTSMNEHKRTKDKPNEKINCSFQLPQKNDYPDRREEEMKKEFGILQSRQDYLERELKAVKDGMFQLSQQIKSYSAYKQLFMKRT